MLLDLDRCFSSTSLGVGDPGDCWLTSIPLKLFSFGSGLDGLEPEDSEPDELEECDSSSLSMIQSPV